MPTPNLVKLPCGNYVNPAQAAALRLSPSPADAEQTTVLHIATAQFSAIFDYPGDVRDELAAILNGPPPETDTRRADPADSVSWLLDTGHAVAILAPAELQGCPADRIAEGMRHDGLDRVQALLDEYADDEGGE